MFAKFLTIAACSLTVAAGMAAAPATAQAWRAPGYAGGSGGFQQVDYRDGRGYRDDRGWRGDRGDRGWRGDRGYRDDRRYRGRGRCYDRGNGGLAIGGIAGGLLGHEVAGRGDRTLGTILGAGVGALAGRAIDRSDGRRC